jgi:hypothetical protein
LWDSAISGARSFFGGSRATVSARDVRVIQQHLTSRDYMDGPNEAMVQRLADAQRTRRALTEGERNFVRHETTEARLMDRGWSYEDAHAAPGRTHPQFRNYDPDVIKAFPEKFGPLWKGSWGIGE